MKWKIKARLFFLFFHFVENIFNYNTYLMIVEHYNPEDIPPPHFL